MLKWAGRVSAGAVVAVWLPVLCFAVLAWQHRWVSDDGYINLRIVWNVLEGNGPNFNPGERVEAGTSPLWIAILVLARIPLWFLDAGWVAVLCGIALSAAGVGFAAVGARRWWASLGRTAPLPLGIGLVVALPPMWDFATSGLETGLSFAWIGACWWATARRLDGVAGTDDLWSDPDPDPGAAPLRLLDKPWWVPVLIGLGPLVRPDFALFTLAFAVAYVATSEWSPRSAWRALAYGLAAPGIYQVFRMGYYGLVIPNTALAKEAGRNLWDRGWTYLDIYLASTLLVLPLVLLLAVFLVNVTSTGAGRRHALVAAMPAVAGLLHAVYVVRVGGDFMYARLFLPGTFALICPLAAMPLPLPRRAGSGAGSAPAPAHRATAPWVALAAWAGIGALACSLVVIGGFRRWDPVEITDDPATPQVDGDLSVDGVANERLVYRLLAGDDHPVTYDDYQGYVEGPLQQLGTLPRDGELIDLGGSGRHALSISEEPMLVAGSIGLVGYRYLGIHIVDQLSLADPLGAHMEAGQVGRPGHEKILSWEWLVARFARPSADDRVIQDARAALDCGRLEELVDAVEDPLTPGRFAENLFGSLSRTRLRVPPAPLDARTEFC